MQAGGRGVPSRGVSFYDRKFSSPQCREDRRGRGTLLLRERPRITEMREGDTQRGTGDL